MKWESLISAQNLKLAWRRINTGTSAQYKRFFREAYLTYEGAVDEHLRELRRALVAKAWQPNHATRLYLPKPSGLQRPLSLLDIEDQILLQAIANKFATKLFRKRKSVELKTVFSNILASPRDSIFFIKRWQKTYRSFQEKCIDAFDQGYKWSVHFDLSAYYDTISHDLLLSILSPQNSNPDTTDTIKEWMQIWSADNIATMTGHGIPQGPVASDFIGEAFFLPIDLRIQKEPFKYLRYVDDIRLFGRTENEVREAAILLEQECRHRGLIPQSSKFEVRELKSPEDAMGAMPSVTPDTNREASEQIMSATEAYDLLITSIDGRPQKIRDKTRFRYIMYRAPEDTKVLNTVLRLLPRHPEHIDAFVAYFTNFSKRRSISKAALNFLDSGVPYSYVRGELWHLVARLGGTEEMSRSLPMARNDARNRSRCMALSWGVMHFLMKCEASGLARIGRRLSAEHPFSRSLLAPIFSEEEFRKGGHSITLLKGTQMEQLAGARELQRRNVTLNSLGLRQRDLTTFAKTTLASLGVTRRRHSRTERDWIGETLTELYGCQSATTWHRLLGSEYEHALQILIEAKAGFHSARSEWLGLQDSFNNIIIRQFFEFLKNKGMKGHSKTINKIGEHVKYGNLIAEGTPFDTFYPNVSKAFRNLHRRRNTLPGSHPYDEKGGSKNRWLTKKERDLFIPSLRRGLDIICAKIEKSN